FNYPGDEFVPDFQPNIVDWILVELRDKVTQDLVAQRAGLLTSAGNIVDVDGASLLSFGVVPDAYFVSIRHRNHLDIVSDATVDFTSGIGMIDFTTGHSTCDEIEPGVFALFKGDINHDQLVKYNGSG